MADSSGRRISLDPFFDPFDLLDADPPPPPLSMNGYHVASSADEDTNLFGGLGSQSLEPSAASLANGSESHGASQSDHTAAANSTDHALNGPAATNGVAPTNGVAATNGAAINGNSFSAHLVSESVPTAPSTLDQAEAEAHAAVEPAFEVVDLQDGPPADALPPEVSTPALDELTIPSDDGAAAEAAFADAAIADAPPSSDQFVEQQADPVAEGTVAEPPIDSPSTAREAHPAAGSMFMPYLVTEVRELRNRGQRRRSWWRRLFG